MIKVIEINLLQSRAGIIKRVEDVSFNPQGINKINTSIPLFIQTAGSLAAVSQPGHILMYAPRLSSLAAFLHLE